MTDESDMERIECSHYDILRNCCSMSTDSSEIIDFLVVDDEPLIHTLVIRMLRSYGLRNFFSVFGANEALRVMRKQRVRFVITDWIMPQMTGIELIRVTREDPLLFATPMLVLTGVCTAEGVLCAMEEGADGYLIKPFTAEKLKKTIAVIEHKHEEPVQAAIMEMRRLKIQGLYNKALKIGQKIPDWNRDPNVLFMVGECLARRKKYPDAIGVLKESALVEKCGKSNNLIGKIYMEQGDNEQGIGYLKEAADQCPRLLSRKVDLAEAHFKSGQRSQAEAVIDTILKSSPTNLIMADLGKLYLEQGDVETAGSFLKNGVTPTPETAHIFNNYAISLRRRGLYEESEAIYRQCIELVPDSFALYFNAGLVYNKMKNVERAIEMFEHALRLNPDFGAAKVFLEIAKGKKTAI